MKRKKLLIGLIIGSVLVVILTQVVFAKPAWKEYTHTYPEVDVAIDIDGDGEADNQYTVGLRSDGLINVMYYRVESLQYNPETGENEIMPESWNTCITIVGTETYEPADTSHKNSKQHAKAHVYDCFPMDNPSQWTHPLIAEKQ